MEIVGGLLILAYAVFIVLVAVKAFFIGGCFDGEERLKSYLPLRLKDFFSTDYKPPVGTDLRSRDRTEPPPH